LPESYGLKIEKKQTVKAPYYSLFFLKYLHPVSLKQSYTSGKTGGFARGFPSLYSNAFTSLYSTFSLYDILN
jgi:hypothetical protein